MNHDWNNPTGRRGERAPAYARQAQAQAQARSHSAGAYGQRQLPAYYQDAPYAHAFDHQLAIYERAAYQQAAYEQSIRHRAVQRQAADQGLGNDQPGSLQHTQALVRYVQVAVRLDERELQERGWIWLDHQRREERLHGLWVRQEQQEREQAERDERDLQERIQAVCREQEQQERHERLQERARAYRDEQERYWRIQDWREKNELAISFDDDDDLQWFPDSTPRSAPRS